MAHFCPGLPLRTSSNTMSDITIYHNPKCGTSRNTLAMIRNSGVEPLVIEYLKTPPTREQLQALIAASGLSVREAVRQGSMQRLRTVLMTALLAMLGLLPMALSHDIGSETQRPLAIVVIGGLVTATLLTLVVLPVLYVAWFSRLSPEEQLEKPAALN